MSVLHYKRYWGLAFCVFIALFSSDGLMAQHNRKHSEKHEKVKEIFSDYVNLELELTEEEKTRFWPLYDELKETEREIRESYPSMRNFELISDKDVEVLIDKKFEQEFELLEVRKKYYAMFKDVIPTRKVAKLMILEKKFKRKLVSRMKQGRGRRK